MPPLVNPNTQPVVGQEQLSTPDLTTGGAQPESAAQTASVERAAEIQTGSSPTPAAAASTPSALQSSSQPATPAPATVGQPAAAVQDVPAADADGIEKAWIDRADAIIATQQNDPYQQEEQQEALSAEYLQKRFNLTVKRSNPPGAA